MWKTGFIIGGLNLILGLGLMMLFGLLFPGVNEEYQSSGLFRPWSDPLMLVYFGYPFILGAVLTYLWGRVKDQFSGAAKEQAFQFAKLYFIIATIPGMFISYTSFQISFMMIVTWTITGYLQAWVAGWVLARRRVEL